MNVYVDSRGIEFQKKKGNRILTFHQRGMVALTDSRSEKHVFNSPTVYKNELLGPRLPTQSCLPNESTDANVPRGRVVYLHKTFQ